MELINYVLDTLHEDLNRVKKKPYVEQKDSNERPDEVVSAEFWENFKLRNKSIVVDLLYGQLKSHLVCDRCRKVSNTFDPFLSISAPIPRNKKVEVKVYWVPFGVLEEPQVAVFQMNEDAGERELRKKVGSAFRSDHFFITRNVGKTDIKEILSQNFRVSHLQDRKGDLVAYERAK